MEGRLERTKKTAWWQFAEDAEPGNVLVRSPCQEAASQKLGRGSSEQLPTHFSEVNTFSQDII